MPEKKNEVSSSFLVVYQSICRLFLVCILSFVRVHVLHSLDPQVHEVVQCECMCCLNLGRNPLFSPCYMKEKAIFRNICFLRNKDWMENCHLCER